MTEENKKKPAFKSKFGSIEGAVWKNKSKDNVFYSITTAKNYRDSEGNWKQTHSLNANDVKDLQSVLEDCYRYIKVTSKAE